MLRNLNCTSLVFALRELIKLREQPSPGVDIYSIEVEPQI